MGKLAALGCDPTPLAYAPMWLAPVWSAVADRAEEIRAEWGVHDARATINALGEGLKR